MTICFRRDSQHVLHWVRVLGRAWQWVVCPHQPLYGGVGRMEAGLWLILFGAGGCTQDALQINKTPTKYARTNTGTAGAKVPSPARMFSSQNIQLIPFRSLCCLVASWIGTPLATPPRPSKCLVCRLGCLQAAASFAGEPEKGYRVRGGMASMRARDQEAVSGHHVSWHRTSRTDLRHVWQTSP